MPEPDENVWSEYLLQGKIPKYKVVCYTCISSLSVSQIWHIGSSQEMQVVNLKGRLQSHAQLLVLRKTLTASALVLFVTVLMPDL